MFTKTVCPSCRVFGWPVACAAFVVGLASAAASGQTACFEMNVEPNAGAMPMTKIGDGFGSLASGDFAAPHHAGLQDGTNGTPGTLTYGQPGTARFVDTGSGTGTHGYTLQGFPGGWTLDMRIKVEESTAGTGNQKAFSFKQASGSGRGIALLTSNIAGLGDFGNGFGVQIRSSGVEGSFNVLRTAGGSDTEFFHSIRLVVPNNNTLLFYDLENDLDPGPGVNYNLLYTYTGSFGSTGPAASLTTGGGLALGSQSNSETTGGKFSIDWVRIDSANALGATDPSMEPCTVACLAGVIPTAIQTLVGFEFGIDPDVAPIAYTFTNASSSTITGYSVTEVTNLGAPTDFPWLTLTNASGNIPSNSNVIVSANIDTTALAAGNYTAYLKFDDTCPTSSCFTDPFTYANGALSGVGGWTGDAQADDIAVAGNEVRISGNLAVGGDAGDVRATHDVSCSPDGDGVVSVKCKLRQGSGDSFIADYRAFDGPGASGNVLGWWRFSGSHIRARTTTNAGLFGEAIIPPEYTEFEMRIYTVDKKTEYYAGGTLLTTFDHPAGSAPAVASVDLARLSRTDVPNDFVFMDDASVTVLERHIRRIDLTVKGCAVEVQEPVRISLGSCGSSSQTTHTFTIKNTGAYDWTGFQAFEFNDDDDWLTVSFTSAPVARDGTASVTATVDWSAAPVTIPGDDLVGVIRFGASCDGQNFIFDTPANTITINDNSSNPPLIFKYEGDVLPSVPNSGGSGFTFVLLSDGSVEQGSIVSDVGIDGALDGLAYRIIDTGSAKTKWRVDPSAQNLISNAAGATIVARVKTVSAAGTPSGNLFIYANADSGTSNGVSAGAHWAGAGGQVVDADRGIGAAIAGDDKYHVIRLTSQVLSGSGNVIRIYVDENPVPALEITNASSVGSAAGSSLESIGFGAGSTGGQQDIYFDCIYGTNAGAFAPGDEDDCVGSMVCVPPCNHPFADADPISDGDGDVDINDFALFQRCYTGPSFAGVLTPECKCFDQDSTGNSAASVDSRDFLKFVACESGPNVPWVPSVACP